MFRETCVNWLWLTNKQNVIHLIPLCSFQRVKKHINILFMLSKEMFTAKKKIGASDFPGNNKLFSFRLSKKIKPFTTPKDPKMGGPGRSTTRTSDSFFFWVSAGISPEAYAKGNCRISNNDWCVRFSLVLREPKSPRGVVTWPEALTRQGWSCTVSDVFRPGDLLCALGTKQWHNQDINISEILPFFLS